MLGKRLAAAVPENDDQELQRVQSEHWAGKEQQWASPSNHLPVISHDAIETPRGRQQGRQQGGMRLESARGSPEGEARGVEGGHEDVASRQTKAQTLPELSQTPPSNHNNGRTVPHIAHPPQHSSPSSKRGVEVSPNAGRRTTLASDVTTDDESDNVGRDGAGGRRSVTSSAERIDEQAMDETDESRLSTLSTTNQQSNYYNRTFTNSDSEVDEVPVHRTRRGRLVTGTDGQRKQEPAAKYRDSSG